MNQTPSLILGFIMIAASTNASALSYEQRKYCEEMAQWVTNLRDGVNSGKITDEVFLGQITGTGFHDKLAVAMYRITQKKIFTSRADYYFSSIEKCTDVLIKAKLYGRDSSEVKDALDVRWWDW